MSVLAALRNLLRRKSKRYVIDDPRAVADSAPYTFFLPSENELLAIQIGDLVKIIVRCVPQSTEWDAERMWATVTEANGDCLAGTLANFPLDMPQLSLGDILQFKRSDVIAIEWNNERTFTPPPPRREYWDRCMVDDCVLYGRSKVDYLYRETPDMTLPDDTFDDSGWRIRGNEQAIADDELHDLSPHYVALGPVLNQDDTWLRLIDSPVGSAFRRQSDDTFVDVSGQ